jgi:hypothetical protein
MLKCQAYWLNGKYGKLTVIKSKQIIKHATNIALYKNH